MISLVQLLKEVSIPKNKWVPLSGNDIKDLEDDILGLIQNAYGPIGGHPNYKSVSDLAGSDYEVIDLDDDSDNKSFVHISKNKVGKITLFPNHIPHFTNTHNDDSERITIAFDLVTQTNNQIDDNNYVRIQ